MSNKINVLFLTPSVRLLGARQSLLALAKQLDKEKFYPIVVCPNAGALSDELIKAGIEVVFIKLYNWRKGKYFLFRPFSVLKLRKLIKERNIDLIHNNESWTTPYAVNAIKKLKKIPIITHMRLSITPRRIKNYLLNKVDKIIVVSQGSKSFFEHDKEILPKVEVVYNGVDIEPFKKGADRQEVRRELGLNENDILIGHLALYSDRKRQLITLEAARKVIAKNQNCHFLFCGMSSPDSTEYEDALRNKIKEYGLKKNVRMMKFRNDVNKVFAALDINLLISSDEGFGRVIIEAGVFAVPSIGTLIGGIPELIDNSKSGVLIKLDDVNALTEKIFLLADNPDQRKQMGIASEKRVQDLFTIQVHTKKIESIYENLLNI